MVDASLKITFLQTADAVTYRPMVELTSATVIEYCSRHDHSYELFLGLKHGYQPWHAALNRIPILKSYIASGYRGWIVYLDADAFVADMDFDLRAYLGDKEQYAIIAARSGKSPPHWWDVNNGVFMINLGHPDVPAFVERVNERLGAISDDDLMNEARWSDVVDDQQLFHDTFKEMTDMEKSMYSDVDGFLNYKGSFIPQYVRVEGSVETRVRILQKLVDNVLKPGGDQTPPEVVERHSSYDNFIRATYRVLLGREPDPGGYESAFEALNSRGATYEALLEAILSSDEYKNKNVTGSLG